MNGEVKLPWQPIETAPRDGSLIIAWCEHSADLENDPMTPYGANAERFGHVRDGVHLVAWSKEYTDLNYPAWWFELSLEGDTPANPTHWLPIDPPEQPKQD